MNNFARRVGHHKVTAIQMSDDKLEAAECLCEANGFGHVQVIAAACKNLVFFLLKDDDHITWLHVGLQETMTSVLIVLSYANYTALFIIAHYIQTEEEQMQISSKMSEVRGSALSTT